MQTDNTHTKSMTATSNASIWTCKETTHTQSMTATSNAVTLKESPVCNFRLLVFTRVCQPCCILLSAWLGSMEIRFVGGDNHYTLSVSTVPCVLSTLKMNFWGFQCPTRCKRLSEWVTPPEDSVLQLIKHTTRWYHSGLFTCSENIMYAYYTSNAHALVLPDN